MWAALVRSLIGGTAGRAAAGGGGLAGMARGLIGKATQAAGGQAASQAVGQAAAKPQINYSRLLGQMGDPLAYQGEKKQSWRDYTLQYREQRAATDQESQRGTNRGQLEDMAAQAGEVAKGFAEIVGNLTGVSDGFEGMQKLLKGDVVGGLKSFGTAAAKAATATFTLPRAISGAVDRMLEDRRELARYDGRSAGAFARLDVRKQMLDINSGQARGESTAELADAVGDLRSAIRPASDSLAIIAAKIGTFAAKLGTFAAKIDPIQKLLGVIAGNTKKDGEKTDLPLEILLGRIGNPQRGAPGFREDVRPPLPPLK